jgi:predicted RNA-binding protein
MAYFLDLFSPETYEAFSRSDRTVSGFRHRQRNAAGKVKPGDKLLGYMTKLSRWVGVLEVISGPFEDSTPIFYGESDPFVVRFKVEPTIWLPKERAVPIHEDEVWDQLSFTKGQDKGTSTWTGKIRASLVNLTEEDGRLIELLLRRQQQSGGQVYEVNEKQYGKLIAHKIRTPDKIVTVTVPEEHEEEQLAAASTAPQVESEVRESIKIQSLIARIGAKMGLRIWIPKADRGLVMQQWRAGEKELLEVLPLNYDEPTLRTIEQIDVLWLRKRSIVRAFEVEHTTSVYSGILRMADLLALQPNMDIKLHIVAPTARRDKVFQELTRPVFSLLERGPLSDTCTYLSYDSLRELAQNKHLTYMSDTVLDEYAEDAD